MTQILYILRHAKSDWYASYSNDWQRPLNKRGKNDLSIMAEKLNQHNVNPDLILSSDALRAEQTIMGIAKYLDFDQERLVFKAELFHADIDALTTQISSQSDALTTLMIVGHNPTMTILANHLCDVNTPNMPTCACVGIAFECESWQEIDAYNSSLLFFETPKNNH